MPCRNYSVFSFTVGVVFFADSFLVSVIFIKIAKNWSAIIGKFLEVEKIMQNYEMKNNAKKHIHVLFGVYIGLSLSKNLSFPAKPIQYKIERHTNLTQRGAGLLFRSSFPGDKNYVTLQ